jgi:EAL domain-containing protein (putative c-di-GMP-specific phosphodiesterase class I)
MITNAEGVETLEQLVFLAKEGCDQVQGYYFGRAMPAEEISVVITDWKHPRSLAVVAAE